MEIFGARNVAKKGWRTDRSRCLQLWICVCLSATPTIKLYLARTHLKTLPDDAHDNIPDFIGPWIFHASNACCIVNQLWSLDNNKTSFRNTIPNFANEKEPKRNFLFSSMKPNFWNYKISFNHGRVWVEWKSLLIWLWSSWITWIAFNPRKVRVVRMSWLDRGLVERKLSCCLFFTFESFHLSIGSDCKNTSDSVIHFSYREF